MKLTKRILAGLIAICTAFSVAGCSPKDKDKKGKAIPLSKTQTELVDALAESDVLPSTELENKTLTWIGHYSILPTEGQVTSPDLYLFQKKYQGEIKEVITDWAGRYDTLAKNVLGGDAPDFFQADDMDSFPKGAIRGMFQPIDPYIDFESPLWSGIKETADSFMFAGSHYVATIRVEPSIACVYNTATIKEMGLDDPAALYASGEWTLDKFMGMCREFVDTDHEKYALDGFWYYDAIQQTTGVPMVSLQDGKLVNNMGTAEIASIENKMYELQKDKVVFPRATNNWDTRGSGATGEGLGDGKTLFIPVGLWAIQAPVADTKTFGDMAAGEIMFVPMPDNTDNEPYYVSARINGYVLCNNAPNPEAYAAFMNCKRACQLDDGVTKIGDQQLLDNYGWNQEMVDMKTEIYSLVEKNPVFEFHQGVNSEVATYFENSICSGTMMDNDEGATKTWTEIIGEFKTTIDFLINEANNDISTTPVK
ncbi:MAG: extracellular solute-binding protein [Clostridiales bacterium]|nr:extracellular solute-binding protein [Clostridiales bacterium]